MATRTATLTCQIEHRGDAGEEASSVIEVVGGLLSGYTARKCETLQLGSGAADQAVTFTSPIAFLIKTNDNEFSLRLKAGEQLLLNLRTMLIWCHDEAAKFPTDITSVLLTGNGSTSSDIEIWVIEKP